MDEQREPIITVGIIEPRAEYSAEVEDALRGAVRAAHSEIGCMLYALHRTNSDPRTFVMVEQWAGPNELADHLAGTGIKTLMAGLQGKLAGAPQVLRCSALPEGGDKLGRLVSE
jgi:quinol monooxygenase YgiN